MSFPAASSRGLVTRVGLVQMACSDDAPANLERALEACREAAGRGAQIVCLQELFATPYFCQQESPEAFDLAEGLDGPILRVCRDLARELAVVLIVPFFERRAAGVYHNSVAIVEADGSVVGLYRKMHIPHDTLYFEKYYFTPGDLDFVAVTTQAARLGPLICWDQWYPEAARLTVLRGAQILLYPTAIGWHESAELSGDAEERSVERDAWETMQRSHAIANGVFVVSVNRVGVEGKLRFWGSSFVCDPAGRVLARAGEEGDEVLVVDCDLGQIETARRLWPFLRDRRLDAYSDLTSRWLEAP